MSKKMHLKQIELIHKWFPYINRSYIIRVYTNNKVILCSANTLKNHFDNEESYYRLLNDVLSFKKSFYTYWNRKSLKIKFIPK